MFGTKKIVRKVSIHLVKRYGVKDVLPYSFLMIENLEFLARGPLTRMMSK